MCIFIVVHMISFHNIRTKDLRHMKHYLLNQYNEGKLFFPFGFHHLILFYTMLCNYLHFFSSQKYIQLGNTFSMDV